MTRYVVGLGSNLGDRITIIRGAVAHLRDRLAVQRVSPVYQTAPVGGPAQPAYLNAAVSLEYSLDPHSLLDELLAIEAAFGRERDERWAARTLDLDILWAGGLRVATERLTIPHPRLHERRFALLPMLELEPLATDATGCRYVLPDGDVALYDALE